MPVFEPSTDISQKQEQLAAILVPVLVMLGGMGLSYGIYTTLKWFSSSDGQGFGNRTQVNEAMARTHDPEKLVAHTTVLPDVQQLSRSTTISAPLPLRPIHPTQLPDAMKSQKNVDTAQLSNSGAQVASTGIPAKGKENSSPHVPKQPSPLKNVFEKASITPSIPEAATHPLHGYRYF